MGIWPGAEHYKRRYQYCAEYVTIMQELWDDGAVRLQGRVLPDGRLPLQPAAERANSHHLRRPERRRHALRGPARRLQFLRQLRREQADRRGPERRPAGRGHQGNGPRLRRAGPDDDHRRRDRRRGRSQVAALQGRHRPRGDRLPRRAGQGRPEHGHLRPAQPARAPAAPTSCRPTRACSSAPMPGSRACWTRWRRCPACTAS